MNTLQAIIYGATLAGIFAAICLVVNSVDKWVQEWKSAHPDWGDKDG